jgi:hypothetical protein
MVEGIEDMLANLYTYFCKSPQKHLEFLKLVEVMETKGLKILRNIKTCWISMLAPVVRVMNEYRTLLVKFQQDSSVRKPKKIAEKCFTNLVDVQTIIGLACIMPMLRLTQSLMKYAQRNDVFVCDFLAGVKRLQKDLNDMYKEERTAFIQHAFWDFNALVLGHHDAIPMMWVTDALDLNSSSVEYLSFSPKDHNIRAIFRDLVTKV